jgi:anti-sigma regulatory factor (Ser/Thr protein kinase)
MRELRQRMTARAENLGAMRQWIAELCGRVPVEEPMATDVKLAVSEACANVVMHAYAGGEPGDLEIEAEPDGDLLRVVVRDEGGGLKPRPDSPGAGLGLPLIAALSDWVEVRRNENDHQTELVMTFQVRPRQAALRRVAR